MISIDAITSKIESAHEGKQIIYYTGFLGRDREEPFHNDNGDPDRDWPTINGLAIEITKMFASGKIYLRQKKKDLFVYEYIAVRANQKDCNKLTEKRSAWNEFLGFKISEPKYKSKSKRDYDRKKNSMIFRNKEAEERYNARSSL